MAHVIESSDVAMLDLLRRADSASVIDMARAMGVTATAVRQRLNRLMGDGLIQRSIARSEDEGRSGRGRPSHRYSLTDAGRRKTGSNFGDLAMAMWKEIRGVKDPEVRRGLLQRLARSMAAMYGDQVTGDTPADRMHSVAKMFNDRQVPFSVDQSQRLPVLVADACPYPGLPEQDRSICAMERMLFSELLAGDVRLTGCRLDGTNCCTFEMA